MSEQARPHYASLAVTYAKVEGEPLPVPAVLDGTAHPLLLPGQELSLDIPNSGITAQQKEVINRYGSYLDSIDLFLAATTVATFGGSDKFNNNNARHNTRAHSELIGTLLAPAGGKGLATVRNARIEAVAPDEVPLDILRRAVSCHPQVAFPELRGALSTLVATAEHAAGQLACLSIVHTVPSGRRGPALHHTGIPLPGDVLEKPFWQNSLKERTR